MKATQVKRFMGSDAGGKAIVNAKVSKVLEMEARMSHQERLVVDKFVRTKLEHFALFDDKNQKMADAAEATRALRDMEKQTKAAAKEYANAKVYYDCELLPAKSVAEDLKQKEIGAVGVFDEQMKILTVGYGMKDVAFRPKPLKKQQDLCQDCCTCCGASWDDVSAHRQKHIVWAHGKLAERGKPDEPPLPMVHMNGRPPVIDIDQTKNPLTKFEVEVMNIAKGLVEKGKVKATVEMVGIKAAHAIDNTLVGKVIQYSMKIARTKKDKCTERYTFTGKVLSYNGDSVIKTKNPAYSAAVSRRRGRGKKATKGKGAANVIPQYISTPCPSVLVQWFEDNETASSVFLVADKYNRAKVVDGWVVVEQDSKDLIDDDSWSTIDKLKQEALEASLLYDINM